MNTQKYIITSSSDKNHWGWCSNLGHEIFFTRKIVLILLSNNLIKDEYIIVTAYNDRKCLYSNIFKNVITFNEFIAHNSLLNENVIDLCPYLLSLFAVEEKILKEIGAPNGKTISCLKKLGLNEENLCDNKIFQNCNTETLNNLCCNINFIDLNNTIFKNIIQSDFIIIHIRPTTKYLDYIYNLIDNFGIKAVIFTQLSNIPDKYLHTSDLQIYASLLNNNNCKFFMSEWSGGGQLAQFCCKSKILYYFDFYPQTYFNYNEQTYRECNDKNFFECWDHYNPINCKRVFLKNDEFENIDFIKKFIYNYI